MIAWLRRTLEDPNTPVFWKIQLFGFFASIIIFPVILLIGFIWFGGQSQINNWMMSYQRWSKGCCQTNLTVSRLIPIFGK